MGKKRKKIIVEIPRGRCCSYCCFQYSEIYANRDAICFRIYTEISEILKK